MKTIKRTFLLCAFLITMMTARMTAFAGMADSNNGNVSYFPIQNTVYRINNDASGTTTKLLTMSGVSYITNISYYKGYIFFTADYASEGSYELTYVCRAKADGSGLKKLALGSAPCIYNGKIYYKKAKLNKSVNWQETRTTGIGRMNIGGGNKKTLLKNANVNNLAVVKNHIFYSIWNKGIFSLSLSGKNEGKISSSSVSINEMYGDSKYLYIVAKSKIRAYDCSRKKWRTIASGVGDYGDRNAKIFIGFKNGYAYCMTYQVIGNDYGKTTGVLYRISLSTKKQEKVFELATGHPTFIQAAGSQWIVFIQTYNNYMPNTATSKVNINGEGYAILKKYFRS